MAAELQRDTPRASKLAQAGTEAYLVEADSEIRKLFRDQSSSNLKKYMWLTIGQDSWLRLIWYEFLLLTIGGMRGAIGVYLRQQLYPTLFRRCGKGVIFGRDLTIRHPHRIEIGAGVVIDDHAVLDGKGETETTIQIGAGTMLGRNSMLVCKGGEIVIGAQVNISVNCTFISESSLTVGEHSLVGGHCYVIAGGNHGTDMSGGVPFVDQPRLQKGGVQILKNCWLGANATILDGTKIGPDTVVGAASLVNHDAPPRCVVAGVPAAVISTPAGSIRRTAK